MTIDKQSSISLVDFLIEDRENSRALYLADQLEMRAKALGFSQNEAASKLREFQAASVFAIDVLKRAALHLHPAYDLHETIAKLEATSK